MQCCLLELEQSVLGLDGQSQAIAYQIGLLVQHTTVVAWQQQELQQQETTPSIPRKTPMLFLPLSWFSCSSYIYIQYVWFQVSNKCYKIKFCMIQLYFFMEWRCVEYCSICGNKNNIQKIYIFTRCMYISTSSIKENG
jgi:hypothetical protein